MCTLAVNDEKLIGFTTCDGDSVPVLPASLVSPGYAAVIVCDPADNEDELKEAIPPDIVTDGWVIPSILNITVPVAVLGDTVAVNVTGLPNVDGFCDEVSVVVVVIWVTVCVNADDVLDRSFVSPEYAAVIVCEPTDSEDELKVACHDDTMTGVCGVPSIVNVTVPVAVFGETSAVMVTD